MIDTVTEPCLDANGGLYSHLELRRDVCALIDAHGFDSHRVAAVAYDVVDAPLLRMQVILDDEHGHALLNDAGDGCVMEWHDTLLRTDLPAWWKPALSQAG